MAVTNLSDVFRQAAPAGVGTAQDARFLLGLLHDDPNGLREADLAVCFEMSPLCGYGRAQGDEVPYSVRRLRAAMAALARSPHVVKHGKHWC